MTQRVIYSHANYYAHHDANNGINRKEKERKEKESNDSKSHSLTPPLFDG